MLINNNNITSTSFSGRIGKSTLSKFRETLTDADYKVVKNFRIGKRNTNIDIVTMSKPQVPTGQMFRYIPEETFLAFSNYKKQNNPAAIVKIADGRLPFNMDTFRLITKDMVKLGESILLKTSK